MPSSRGLSTNLQQKYRSANARSMDQNSANKEITPSLCSFLYAAIWYSLDVKFWFYLEKIALYIYPGICRLLDVSFGRQKKKGVVHFQFKHPPRIGSPRLNEFRCTAVSIHPPSPATGQINHKSYCLICNMDIYTFSASRPELFGQVILDWRSFRRGDPRRCRALG